MINIKISYSLSARSTDTVSWICVFSFYYVAALNGRVSNNCDNTTDTICKYGWSIRFTNEQWIDKQAFVHHWPSHCSYFYCSSGLNFSYMNWHWRIVLKCHCTYTHLLCTFFSDQSAISVFVSCKSMTLPIYRHNFIRVAWWLVNMLQIFAARFRS